MAAPVLMPAARSSQSHSLGWLPAGGYGNGLDDNSWVPVLVISEQVVPKVLGVLQAALVPAHAGPTNPAGWLRDRSGQPADYRQLAAASAAFATVAGLAAAADQGWLADADRQAFEAIRERRTETGTRVARGVSALAEPAVVYPALALAGLVAARGGRRWRAGVPFLVVVGGATVRRRLSQVIARSRPPAGAWLIEPEGFSFPSKHTTLAALAAGASVRALGFGVVPTQAASLLAAAGIGASRIYLGVHWPTDVIAGWLFAEGWLSLTDPG
jgi:membrane-associated phospholipid phosphatase